MLLSSEVPAERVVACIGLISDTHMPARWRSIPNAVYEIFRGVDLILHAGDVGELWVLDQLSQIAPVIAVHGNDDTKDAQRELPYQQVITVAGQRILLWHSHFADRIDEVDSRKGDEMIGKLDRSIERARRCGAKVVIFGHWHIPFTHQHEEILVINPGAVASGNVASRQLVQTVALLFIRDDGVPFVNHIDLAAPDRIYLSPVDLAAGFKAALDQFSASILSPELEARSGFLIKQLQRLGTEYTLPPIQRVAHRVWAGQQERITLTDWLAEVRGDPELSAVRKVEYEKILIEA